MSVHDDLHFLSKPNSRHQLSEIEIAGRPKLLVLWAGQLWQGHVWIEIWKVPTLGSTLQMMTDDGGQKKWRFRLWSFDRVNICCFLSLKWEKLVLGLDLRQPTLLAVWIWQGRKAMQKSRIGTYIGRVAREEMSVHNSTSKQQDTDQHRSIRHPKRLEDSWNSLKIMWVRQ